MLAEKLPIIKADPHLPQLARLVRIDRSVKDRYVFHFRFEDPAMNEKWEHRPGQFVMLSILGVGEAPISICSSGTRKGTIELCVNRIGRVTNALYRLRENDLVGIRGPYGNGYPMEEMAGHDLLLIAGGIGMAPLRSVVWYALDNRNQYGDITLLCGSRSTRDLLFREELESLWLREDMDTHLIVERVAEGDTWAGKIGVVTDLFKYVNVEPRTTYAAVCGPPVFYKFVVKELMNLGFSKDRVLMSLERKMKCGIGKCAHCTIGYKYTCIHGPIFTLWDAMNLPEMI